MVASVALSGSAGGFDLGGECEISQQTGWQVGRDMQTRAARGEWEDALEAGMRYIRAMCSNSYRWAEVLDVLLKSPRRDEAFDFLWEMHTRHLDLDDPRIDWKAIEGIQGFGDSEIGKLHERSTREIAALQQEALGRVEWGRSNSKAYWADEVCPGEYCGLGTNVLLDRSYAVYDTPEGGRVGALKRCERIDQLQTKYRSPMVPHVVIYDYEDQTCHRRGARLGCGKFERGDLVYYVIYSGEGFVRVLHDGAEKIVDDPHRLLGDCRFASRRCWVTSLAPASKDQAVVDDQLWVEIQRVDGSKVWTNEIALHSAYEEVDPDPERRKRRQELAAECAKN